MPLFTCDFSQTAEPFPHFWEHTVGSGHAPLALRADWQAQLQPCHKPVYRAFELLHRMGTELLPVEGSHETAEMWVSREQDKAVLLLVNHAPPRQTIQTEKVDIRLTGTPEPLAAHVERIDADHANPRRQWVEMGEPTYLSHQQVQTFQAASRLVKESLSWEYEEDETVRLTLALPPHSVSAVTIEYAPKTVAGGQ